MPKSRNKLLRSLNPFRYPWEAAKAPLLILNQRLHGGGDWGALWTSPWGTYGTIKWIVDNYTRAPKFPRGPGLNVVGTETDANAFAIYGVVRVSGVSVIPP